MRQMLMFLCLSLLAPAHAASCVQARQGASCAGVPANEHCKPSVWCRPRTKQSPTESALTCTLAAPQVLPFNPLNLTFHNLNYYVPLNKVRIIVL